MRDGYSVTVTKHGDPILTIGPDLSGLSEFSPEDEQAIRDAGEHLLAFIGPERCSVCGAVLPCGDDCAPRDIPF